MAQSNYFTSESNQLVVDKLQKMYNLKSSNIIIRIAIMYSLQLNKVFDLENDTPFDSTGKEYREVTVFGEFNNFSAKIFYKTIFNQHYSKNLSESEFQKIIKLHMDHGLEKLNEILILKNNIPNFHIDFLARCVNDGIRFLDTSFISQEKKSNILSYDKIVNFTLGKNTNGEDINIRLNDLNVFDSHHIAIAGMTGSGKTELIKDILYQISKNTSSNLKFIFFDYKGEGNSKKLNDFLSKTNCRYLDLKNESFDLNPLSYINNTNDRQKNYGISSFVDAINAIVRLGPKQQSSLKNIINMAFDGQSRSTHPQFDDINKYMFEYYSENELKEDSLTSIISTLSSQIFKEETGEKKIYEENIYLSLPSTLSDTIRQLTVFLTLKYLFEKFVDCEDVTPDNNRINPLRYVIVIDEAHVYLKNKQACKILENILRVVRSKGVVVIMLSQSPLDYKSTEFDFVSQVKIPICLNINDKDLKVIKSFVGTPKSEMKLQNVVNKLDNGKGIINLTEPEIIDINMFWKSLANGS